MLSRSVSESSTLQEYLQVLRRRKFLFFQSALLVPIVAVLFSLAQTPLYEASSDVILSRQTATNGLFQDQTAVLQPERFVDTEADVARNSIIAKRAVASAGVSDRSAGDLLAALSVTPKKNRDALDFTVTDEDPDTATRLANAYAREYTEFRRELDGKRYVDARRFIEQRIEELREEKSASSAALIRRLRERAQDISVEETLLSSNASVIREAGGASQTQPQPVRNGILGLAFGLVLGIGFAFLFEALDTRVWSVQEVGQRLGLQLLGRLPAPSAKLRRANQLVMAVEPHGSVAEAFRVLRTNLDFANLDRGARTIMVTSAVMGEGKSTTVANLAVALAREGRRVTLVDLDLRQPAIGRFFGLDSGQPGITDVALGRVSLEQAIVRIPLSEVTPSGSSAGNGQGASMFSDVLEVLPAGRTPPDPGEFVSSRALAKILDDLRGRSDMVLVDTPPLLHVGDAMTLSAKLEALIVVARLNIVRRPMLAELTRALGMCRAEKLGFVATGADSEDSYGAYYDSTYATPKEERVA